MQWTIRHGWIQTDDTESLRHYFATSPNCEEFYVVSNEPRNNTLQMFGEIRADFKNKKITDATRSNQFEARKANDEQLLGRNRMRVTKIFRGSEAKGAVPTNHNNCRTLILNAHLSDSYVRDTLRTNLPSFAVEQE